MSRMIDQIAATLTEEQRTQLNAEINQQNAAQMQAEIDRQVALRMSQLHMASPSSSSSPSVNPLGNTSPGANMNPSNMNNMDMMRMIPTGIKPHPPPVYSGDRHKVDQFLTQLNRYLELSGIASLAPRVQVEYAAQFLSGDALVWFQNVKRSGTPIASTDEFSSQLRAHFLPYGIDKVARSRLRSLKQTSTVQAYSTLFMQTLQHISDMSAADQLDHYLFGLKHGIQRDVVMMNPTTLHQAMNHAAYVEARFHHYNHGMPRASFVPMRPSASSSSAAPRASSSVPSGNSDAMDLSNVDAADSDEAELNAASSSQDSKLGKLTDAERERLRKEGRCFRCREKGHLSRNCPKNGKSQ